VSGGDHRWFKRSTGKKRPVTGDIMIMMMIIMTMIIIIIIKIRWTNQNYPSETVGRSRID